MLKKIFGSLKQFIETETKDKSMIAFNIIGICIAAISFFMLNKNNDEIITRFIMGIISIIIGGSVRIILLYLKDNYKLSKDKIVFLVDNIQICTILFTFFICFYNFNYDDILVNVSISILIALTVGWIVRFIFGNVLIKFLGQSKE